MMLKLPPRDLEDGLVLRILAEIIL